MNPLTKNKEERRQAFLKKLQETEDWEMPYLICCRCEKEIPKIACYYATYANPPRCFGRRKHRGAEPLEVWCTDCKPISLFAFSPDLCKCACGKRQTIMWFRVEEGQYNQNAHNTIMCDDCYQEKHGRKA